MKNEPLSKIKTIIFDFDGVIGDSFDDTVEIVEKLLKKFKRNMSKREIEELLRNKGFKGIVKEYNLSKFDVFLLVYYARKELKKLIDKIKPFEGIKFVLEELGKRGYKMGIISTNSKSSIKRFLKKNDLEYFDFVLKTTLFGKHKTFEKALKKYGLEKDEVICIGDEIRDVEAAKKVGLKMIATVWGYNSRELIAEYEPDYVIDKPKEILDILV